MNLLLQDSGRWNSWWLEALETGHAGGVILSPFSTPQEDLPYHASAQSWAEEIRARGGDVYFDATTHGCLMPGADDFDPYDRWNLWSGDRGDLGSDDLQRGHIERVFERQTDLGAPRLGPTVALDGALSEAGKVVLDLAKQAMELDADAGLSVAGTSAFWRQGTLLDEFVGMLAQFRPPFWFLTVIRPRQTIPPLAESAEEVEGICRTVHSLSSWASVVLSHADLAGLPALAAGAEAIGTGWDLGQRVCAPDGFRQREGGQAVRRITHFGLLSVLSQPEAEMLRQANQEFSQTVVPGDLPTAMKEDWQHHLVGLNDVLEQLSAIPDRASRVSFLRDRYLQAEQNFAQAGELVPELETGFTRWGEPLLSGLEGYAADEGF